MSGSARLLALAAGLLLCGCTKDQAFRICEACIEKEGQFFCGKSATNLRKHPEIDEEASKLAAGRAACTEYGARKGGGYAGPIFHEVEDGCSAKLAAKDLRRVRCEDQLLRTRWHPKDGIDSL